MEGGRASSHLILPDICISVLILWVLWEELKDIGQGRLGNVDSIYVAIGKLSSLADKDFPV